MAQPIWLKLDEIGHAWQNFRRCRLIKCQQFGHTPTRRHFHWRLRALWMNLASPLARPLGTRRRPQRRMSLVWESYCATRSRSSLHTEAPIEPLRQRPDQSEARQPTVGVLQIEAEPLVLHTKLVQSRPPARADCDGDLPMLVAAVFYRIHQ